MSEMSGLSLKESGPSGHLEHPCTPCFSHAGEVCPVRVKRSQMVLFLEPEKVRAVDPLARAGRLDKRRGSSPAPKPWLAVVLGVDTAARSGWAVSVSGRLVESGEVDTLAEVEVERVVRSALTHGAAGGLPVVLVLEAPYGGRVEIIAALGVARERWLRAWRAVGQSPRRVVRVQPSTWRAAVLGQCAIGKRRDEVRALEQQVAAWLFGRELGADEAPACLIARWGSQAGVVGKAIGVKGRKASLMGWQESNG
jgi:hypothetical protein